MPCGHGDVAADIRDRLIRSMPTYSFDDGSNVVTIEFGSTVFFSIVAHKPRVRFKQRIEIIAAHISRVRNAFPRFVQRRLSFVGFVIETICR
jgi:hypothetical protein